MDGVIATVSSSVSSLYGNVGCAIREFILSKFPKDFFKYTTVSSEVAFRNMRRQFGSNTNTEIAKRRKPYLIIQPQYTEVDPDGFLQKIPLTENKMDTDYGIDCRYLFKIIHDSENMYNLRFKINRRRLEYEITIRVSTQMQQIDLYNAMVNQMTWDNWQYYTAALESVIPKSIIRYISKLCNMDIDNTPEFTPMLLRHMNSISAYPITYKLRNASATDEFFMYYTHHLMVLFQDLSIGGGNRKGMIEDDFELTFKVQVEFNMPGVYVLDSTVDKANELRIMLGAQNIESSETEYIPLYTITNFFNKYPTRMNGLTLYTSFIMHTDAGKKVEDNVDLHSIFSNEQAQALQYHVNQGMLPNTMAQLIVLKNRQELNPDTWSMNWNTLNLIIKDPDDTASYRVLIYLNMETINEVLANTRIDGPYDKHALRGSELQDPIVIPEEDPEVMPEPETPQELPTDDESPDTPETQEEPSEEIDPNEQEKVIMKYSSSIFDKPNTVVADEPVSKSKFSSSADPNRKAAKVTYHDSPNPSTITALDVWAKIISNAMLYNFASKIALDNDNSYSVDIEVSPPDE